MRSYHAILDDPSSIKPLFTAVNGLCWMSYDVEVVGGGGIRTPDPLLPKNRPMELDQQRPVAIAAPALQAGFYLTALHWPPIGSPTLP